MPEARDTMRGSLLGCLTIGLIVAGCGAKSSLRVRGAASERDAFLALDSGLASDAGRDASAPTELDAGPVAEELDGLRWELPCIAPSDLGMNICDSAPDISQSATVHGAPGAEYDVTLRFRGVVERKVYVGGRTEGAWNEGGVPADDTWNVYSLEISSPPLLAYVNAGGTNELVCEPVDFTRTVRVAAGAEVRLRAQSINGLEMDNVGRDGSPILVDGVAPFPAPYQGQFVQMDVIGLTRR